MGQVKAAFGGEIEGGKLGFEELKKHIIQKLKILNQELPCEKQLGIFLKMFMIKAKINQEKINIQSL